MFCTNCAQEDHVSMGGYAARKALKVVENVERVIGIELYCAVVALHHLGATEHHTTKPLQAVFDLNREKTSFKFSIFLSCFYTYFNAIFFYSQQKA